MEISKCLTFCSCMILLHRLKEQVREFVDRPLATKEEISECINKVNKSLAKFVARRLYIMEYWSFRVVMPLAFPNGSPERFTEMYEN